TIFVACKGKNPTGSREIADRAREALNDPQHEGYNLITKNCHQFCHYCLTGKIDNGIDDFTFTALEDEMMRIQGMDTWRRWEFE
ncbi:MAG: lecithin retinol acyltransferase family protein, partial [Synergistaceae bacterium]|nr:lecithin retinol acyltransferase family protein [Synergistaceae bacterium]